MLLTPTQMAAYDEEGYLLLQGVLDADTLDLVEGAIERNEAAPSPWAATRHTDECRYHEDRCNFSVGPEIQSLLYDSPIVDYLAELMETDRVWLYYDQVICKRGETGRTSWHQDMSYYLMKPGRQVTGAWIPIDVLDEESALEVVARSHRGPLYNMQAPGASVTNGFEHEIGSEPVPDIDADRGSYEIRSFSMKPGDMLIFHPQTLHGGAATRRGGQRRAISINVFGPEMVYEPRPNWHSPKYPGLENVLKPGEPLHRATDAGYFPQLRPLPTQRAVVRERHDLWYGRNQAEADGGKASA